MTVLTSSALIEPTRALALPEAPLLAYLHAHLPSFPPAPLTHFRIRQFGHGQSNPTYLLEARSGHDANAFYVLRKKPPGELLASAHAVEREFRVLKGLAAAATQSPQAHQAVRLTHKPINP
jgi:acyl-CoA dehydrogenase